MSGRDGPLNPDDLDSPRSPEALGMALSRASCEAQTRYACGSSSPELAPAEHLWELGPMTKQDLLDEILRLPVEERIELLGEAWDQLAGDSETVPVPEWHLKELERRLAEPDPTYVPWSELRAQLGLGNED